MINQNLNKCYFLLFSPMRPFYNLFPKMKLKGKGAGLHGSREYVQ